MNTKRVFQITTALAVVIAGIVLTQCAGRKASTGIADPTAPKTAVASQNKGEHQTTLAQNRGADAPMPPMDTTNLQQLIAAYSTDELQMLADVQKSTHAAPPVELQEVIRMVRRKDETAAIQEFIREKVPGIPAKTAAYSWAMKKIHPDQVPEVRPLFQGGNPSIIHGIEGSQLPPDPQQKTINPPQ